MVQAPVPFAVPLPVHRDVRGAHTKFLGETPAALALSFPFEVKETFMTTNVKNAVRGLHFQVPPQAKLVQALTGKLWANVLCCDRNSPHFGELYEFYMTAQRPERIYVPHLWAFGYRSLENDSRVLYLADEVFIPEGDKGIDPFDPALRLYWGSQGFGKKDAVLSPRDMALPPCAAVTSLLERV